MLPTLNLDGMTTPANKVAGRSATSGNFVATLEITTLADLIQVAGARLRLRDKQIADLFNVSKGEFSKAVSPNVPERGRLLKQPVPPPFLRAMALVLCDALDLKVQDTERVGADWELIEEAVDVIETALRMLKRSGR